jgi:hypothetical protein
VCRRIESPFNELFSRLSRLPTILCAAQKLLASSTEYLLEGRFLCEQIIDLREDLQTWRCTPAYAKLFHTTSWPSVESFCGTNLIYTSRNAVNLLCTHAAMVVLLNSALLVLLSNSETDIYQLENLTLSNSETDIYQLENLTLSKQICQSYEYSRRCSLVGSLAMDFAFRVAYIVPNTQQKKWIVEKMNEMANPLGGPRHTEIEEAELDCCFDYLRY